MEIFGQTITLSNRFKIISHSKKIKAIIALGPFSSLSSFLDLGMNVQGRRNRGGRGAEWQSPSQILAGIESKTSP